MSRRTSGLTVVELLVALSISAALLTAVTTAINASFYSYANSAELASTQSSCRLVVQRLMSLIRTTTLHDAYDPDDDTLTLIEPSMGPLRTTGLEMIDPDGRLLRVWWVVNATYDDTHLGDLWYRYDDQTAEPMLERVRARSTADGTLYVFSLLARKAKAGLLLSRATIDLTVETGADANLGLESVHGVSTEVRLIASAMPRKNLQ